MCNPLVISEQYSHILCHNLQNLRTTVAVITYNRSRFLKETLVDLVRQDYPAGHWEILVIDNNSTDDTAAVVAAFASRDPAPRHVIETEQGLDHGRNRAIAEAKGELLVLIDDDVLMEPDWLNSLTAPFSPQDSDRIGVVGGEVIPVFPDGLPDWLQGAHRPLGFRADPGPLPPGQSPMGANFAFPRALFARLGNFNTTLDQLESALISVATTAMPTRW